jgi:hypothetical protein
MPAGSPEMSEGYISGTYHHRHGRSDETVMAAAGWIVSAAARDSIRVAT